MLKSKVWVDYHQRNNLLVVFVCGYALDRASSSLAVANDIAKELGLKEFLVTTYPAKARLPIKETETVY